jgi:signal transduction histidine kinase
MKIRLLFVFLAFSGKMFGQGNLSDLRKEISRYTYANHFDSAEAVVMHFLERKDLSPLEVFYGHFYYCDLLKSLGKNQDAISGLAGCKKYLVDLPQKKILESLINGDIAECYFSMMNYEEAKKYALRSLELSPDSSLRSSGHGVNYMMLGYAEFAMHNYATSLEYYERTLQAYRASGEICELPLCYMKMAKVYNSMHREKLMEENISKAVRLSDSCGIDNYKLLSKRTLFDIYKENKNYSGALVALEEINDMVAKLESEKQRREIGELEVKYNTRLSEQENQNLKDINKANEKTLAIQSRTLEIVIGAAILLCLLIFFLIRIFLLREKAKKELEALNADLEQKVADRTQALAEDNQLRKNLEKQLNEKVKEMETLISKLSHDMRSPLSSVLGLINVAEMESFEGKETCFDKMKESVKKMDDIIIDLTSTIYVSTMPQRPELIQFKEMVNELIGNFQFDENFGGISFHIEIKQQKDFYSDAKFIRSILQNLIENAVKYGGNSTGAQVGVSVEEDEKGVIIQVKDNGSGIMPEFHDKIFDMFFRASNSSKGSGLGLYIVKIAVGKLNGKIELRSEPSMGTTFTIYLPDLIRGIPNPSIPESGIVLK